MSKGSFFSISVIIISIAISIFSSYLFISYFFSSPGLKTSCKDMYGIEIKYIPETAPTKEYCDCITNNAKIFIERDYSVSSDLSKAFLTLLAALLVVAVTFSEKIISNNKPNQTANTLMFTSWGFLLISIIACGTGLAFMTVAVGWASYQPFCNFRIYETKAFYLFISSGFTFCAGLVSLLASGIISFYDRKK